MNSADVKRFALILAVQAEIEGMKAINTYRSLRGETIAYGEESFRAAAEELREIAHKHEDAL